MGEEFYLRQRELMGGVLAQQNVVIATAAVPGKKAPILVTAEMVGRMAPGSVIVDIAAERGGNCELSRADERVIENGVTILGPTNLPATVAFHASQLYSKNLTNFLKLIVTKEGALNLDLGDEIIRETMVTNAGEVVHPRLRQLLNLEVKPAPATATNGGN